MRSSVFLLLLAMPCAARAQVQDILPGSRVRVHASPSARLEGTLMTHSVDSMVVASSGAVRTAVPYASVSRLQVSQGKSRGAGAIKGMKIGAAIGGGTALLLGLSVSGSDTGIGFDEVMAVTGMYAVSGGLWGLLIGTMVGAERWTTVYQASPARSAATRSLRPGVSVSYAF